MSISCEINLLDNSTFSFQGNIPRSNLYNILLFNHTSSSTISLINKYFSNIIYNKRSKEMYNFIIQLKTLRGKNLYINHSFNYYSTILELNKYIAKKYHDYFPNIQSDKIKLIYQGKILQNTESLIRYRKLFTQIPFLHMLLTI